MKLSVYSIFDNAAGAFMQPFFMVNDGMAVRAFSDTANTADSSIKAHPDQFSLYRVGTWNDASGYLEPEDPPIRVIHGFEVVERNQQTVSSVSMADLEARLDEVIRKLGDLS